MESGPSHDLQGKNLNKEIDPAGLQPGRNYDQFSTTSGLSSLMSAWLRSILI